LTNKERNSWGFSLFCDDIRGEIGGKMSAMGIYQTDLIFPPLPDFPFTIPKFCILIKYYELLNAFTDDISVRVFLPGDAKDSPTVTLPFLRSTLGATQPLPPLEDDQERLFNLTFPLMLSPCTFKQEGFLKVRVVCGSTTTNLGSVMIRRARPDENLQWFVPPPPVSGAAPSPT
jgi:hypothetical protein